ncbi:hypothetical protein BD311DRAFT_781206 [Dichomitus squalens]|uniref:DUF6533 domain-containing protein n=1 Tax=Dichomitus squalens TaxID=114155 RepID=A0A4Q9ME82_9APHY|nr:hypothetical protein BD311DRAFT_781206 [Dichomitus squalens]
MASLPPPTLADLNTLAASRYFLPAVATMAIYECLITLANEVDYVWKTGWTGASIVYYFNKYLFLVTYIGGIVGIAVPGASIELLNPDGRRA